MTVATAFNISVPALYMRLHRIRKMLLVLFSSVLSVILRMVFKLGSMICFQVSIE